MTPEEKELKKAQKRLKKEAKSRAKVEKQHAKKGNEKYAEPETSTTSEDEAPTKKVLKEKEIKKNLYNRKNFKTKKTKEKID